MLILHGANVNAKFCTLNIALMKKAFHEIWEYKGARSTKTKDDNVLNNSHISATLTLLNMAGRLR